MTGERSRLTLTGRTREDRFGAVLLFRSRYLAPAAHSARFYREYFRPAAEHVVRRIGAAGWSPIAASSSTCTSIG